MNLQCIRYGYLTGQPVLQYLSILMKLFPYFLPQDHLTQWPTLLWAGCGFQSSFLARSAWNIVPGRFLQVLSSLHSNSHVLQRQLPSMGFEEQVFFAIPDFCRIYTSREPGPAWSISGLAGHWTKASFFWVYPLSYYCKQQALSNMS